MSIPANEKELQDLKDGLKQQEINNIKEDFFVRHKYGVKDSWRSKVVEAYIAEYEQQLIGVQEESWSLRMLHIGKDHSCLMHT